MTKEETRPLGVRIGVGLYEEIERYATGTKTDFVIKALENEVRNERLRRAIAGVVGIHPDDPELQGDSVEVLMRSRSHGRNGPALRP